jgi:hypothetical protein
MHCDEQFGVSDTGRRGLHEAVLSEVVVYDSL